MKTNLFEVLEHDGNPPIVVNVVCNEKYAFSSSGPVIAKKNCSYVLLSALPTELQERVKLAVQALMSGI